jgi:hypothetical protein
LEIWNEHKKLLYDFFIQIISGGGSGGGLQILIFMNQNVLI